MNLVGGFIGGTIGGLIGASAWAGIAYLTGYEVGWIAWGVGLLVGVGFAAGAKQGGPVAGAGAVVIAALSLIAGKYAAIELMLSHELGDLSEISASVLEGLQDDQQAIGYLADRIVAKLEEGGQPVAWPELDHVDEHTPIQALYPADVWQEASRVWTGMSPDEQQSFREQAADSAQASFSEIRDAMAAEGFFMSFGFMDILFFGLAIAAAYKIAYSASTGQPDNDMAGDQSPPEDLLPDETIGSEPVPPSEEPQSHMPA